ncbi:hypothetical protein [Chryseobacterium sp. WLY505]|nr:hypothetical protein [Chryseobacterium sp. WLY505]MDQ1858425.1 hypothetical protein [Chryseobacterium sp. WLY505]
MKSLSGGISSTIAGGNFWDGFRQLSYFDQITNNKTAPKGSGFKFI